MRWCIAGILCHQGSSGEGRAAAGRGHTRWSHPDCREGGARPGGHPRQTQPGQHRHGQELQVNPPLLHRTKAAACSGANTNKRQAQMRPLRIVLAITVRWPRNINNMKLFSGIFTHVKALDKLTMIECFSMCAWCVSICLQYVLKSCNIRCILQLVCLQVPMSGQQCGTCRRRFNTIATTLTAKQDPVQEATHRLNVPNAEQRQSDG